MDVALQRKNMVESQVRPSDVTDRRIIAAMQAIPREAFVPAELKSIAYLDTPLPVAPRRSLLPPRLLAKLVQLAGVEAGHKILDVGGATGYTAAILAALGATVTLLESDPALAAAARTNINTLKLANISVVEGPLAEGAADRAPFDIIIIEGSADLIPPGLSAQLGDGGRLVAILQEGRLNRAVVGLRAGQSFDVTTAFEGWADPLPGFERPPAFAF